MSSMADGLPSEIARHVHPDWRQNEMAYWEVREQLLDQYQGKWIGFADGKVVATGARPVVVLHASRQVAAHPYVTCVGKEDQPFRVRRAAFSYDSTYAGEPLPVLPVEFRPNSGQPGLMLDQVIADTGADTTILPWADCQQMQLDPALGTPDLLLGVAGGATTTLSFLIWTYLDGTEYPCQLLADFAGRDRILGRDVLNSLEVLFRGPRGELVVNP
jgi:predicted aspartyl protease